MSATTNVGVHFSGPVTRDDVAVFTAPPLAWFRTSGASVFFRNVDDLRAFGALLVELAEENGAKPDTELAELRAAHAQAVDELRLWGAATVTQSDTGHGRARLGGAA